MAEPRPWGVADIDYWWRLFGLAFAIFLVPVLIFVMVVIPVFPDLPMLMDFPISSTAEKHPEFEYDETVSVLRIGAVIYRGEQVTFRVLSQRLRKARLRGRGEWEPAVRVRVDKAAPFWSVRSVVRSVRDAGFPRLTFMLRTRDSMTQTNISY